MIDMANVLKVLGTGKFWKELFIMTFGMMIGGAAVYYFMVPSKLVIGTISGLSIVLSNIFAAAGITIKVSWLITGINAVLLVLAWLLSGSEFGAKTVYTALILGPMMDFWDWVLPYQKLLAEGQTSVMGDVWFDLICFVFLLSLSQSVLFHINASTGGLDIIAKIVNKYLHFDIGTSVAVAGCIIGLTAFAINPFRMVVIGLIGTWINGLVLDHFTASINRKKRVCIISKDYERIREHIVNDLHRGCTLYPMKGGFSMEDSYEIQVLLTRDEFSNLLQFVKENNLHTFITAGNVSEVYGEWNMKHAERRLARKAAKKQ